jgi:methylenetetrahydrofolate dehydrogenase (NADP+) / methenyltetrahydrofolate cyclohydrolase
MSPRAIATADTGAPEPVRRTSSRRTRARPLAGSPIAAEIRAGVRADVAAFRRRHGYAPTLAVVLVGRDAPSAVYLEQILKTCRSVGITGRRVEVPGRASVARLRKQISELNADPLVAGIIVQMPLPKRIPLATVTDTIDPAKDIDGLHPLNAGRLTLGHDGFLPTTAQAAVEILKRSGIPIAGRRAVVVGRSNIVGKPAALLLLRENATVTTCHSHTRDLAAHVRSADIVVVAVGKPGLITGSMLKRGAVVVDIGINVVDGQIVGDVDAASAIEVASALTPVPGGVGPVTNALLMTHLMRAAERQAGEPARRGNRPSATGRHVSKPRPRGASSGTSRTAGATPSPRAAASGHA